MKMIDDARMGKFDLIITKEISRFSRNTLDSIKYTRELLSYGVAVLFVNDNINTALPDAELRLTIMASMAQDEIRRLSERVKFGMHRAIERGEILGNNRLYGYVKDKKTGKLNIVLEEAVVVKRIYELYVLEKYSLSKIARQLTLENAERKWCVSTLSRMISNPKYKGYYCGKKSEIIDYMTKKIKYFDDLDWITYEAKDKIPPIIDETLWNLANKRLNERSRSFHKREDKTIYQQRYLYSAKLFCKEHQIAFHRREFRKHKKDVTWVCANYLKYGKKVCDSPNIRESELNEVMNDILSYLTLHKEEVIQILMHHYYACEKEHDTNKELEMFHHAQHKLESKKEKLLELNIEEKISNHEFYERNEALNLQIKKLKEEIKSFTLKHNIENNIK